LLKPTVGHGDFTIACVVSRRVRRPRIALEALSGSNGLSACADTTLVLDRDSSGITLFVRGRDVEEKKSALAFNAGSWTLTGDAAEVRRTDERTVILEALHDADAEMSPSDLSAATGMTSTNLRQLLFKMAKAGEVVKAGRGRYRHPLRMGPDHNDNIDNKVTDDSEAEDQWRSDDAP
jgi:hypothetical protein